MKEPFGKILGITAIVLMGMTATMNILGGIGTVCAAFLTKRFPPMWALLDYQWLYQIIMIITIGLGVAGAWATLRLIKGGEKAYRNALLLLSAGTVVGAVQVFASLALRGKAVPANMKLYINALTLIVFLLLRLPGLRERVNFSKPGEASTQATASGLTSLLTGILVLSVGLWVGGSHTYQGWDWVAVLKGPLTGSGLALLLMGLWNLKAVLRFGRQAEFPLSDSRAPRS